MSNSTKVWLLLILSALSVLIAGYWWNSREGLLISFACVLFFALLLFFFDSKHLLKKLKAKKIEGQDSWNLGERVLTLSKQTGCFPPPEIYFLPMSAPSVCIIPKVGDRPGLALSPAFTQKFDLETQNALLIYMLFRLKHMNSPLNYLSFRFTNSWLSFADRLEPKWLGFKPLSLILTPLCWFIIRFHNRTRSFFAIDSTAGSISKNSKSLAQALWMLQAYSETLPFEAPFMSEYLFAVPPKSVISANRVNNKGLHLQPSVATRIRRLVGYYPL